MNSFRFGVAALLALSACSSSSSSSNTDASTGSDASGDATSGGTCASSAECAVGESCINGACHASPSDGGTPYQAPEAGASCFTSIDCAPGLDCAYLISGGCGAKGVCLFAAGVVDGGGGCTTETTCGCDGQTHRFLCYPAGYAITPTQYVGECEGGAMEAGGGNDGGDGGVGDAGEGGSADASGD